MQSSVMGRWGGILTLRQPRATSITYSVWESLRLACPTVYKEVSHVWYCSFCSSVVLMKNIVSPSVLTSFKMHIHTFDVHTYIHIYVYAYVYTHILMGCVY